MGKTQQQPPEHLSTSSKTWWKEVVSKYEFTEGHSLKLLNLAATALDTAEDARKTVADEGATIMDRHSVAKRHPAVSIELQAVASFVRLLDALGINDEVSSSRPAGNQPRELPA